MLMEKYLFENFLHLDRLRLGVRYMRRRKNMEMFFHDHDFSELVIILQSENSKHWVDDRKCSIRRGDVLLIHPGVSHAYQNTGMLKLVNVLFNTRQMSLPTLDAGNLSIFQQITSSRNDAFNVCEMPIVNLNEKALKHVLDIIKELNYELKHDLAGKNLIAFSLFLQLITCISRFGKKISSDTSGNNVEKALNYLNLHFNEKISIKQLAKMSYLSERSLYLRFRELTGFSPMEYRKKKQLEYAEYLLRSSSASLHEIAEKCGFCDSNHLGREFSRTFNISPAKFRRMQNL